MKKNLFKIIISILCLLALLFGTACGEPEAPAAPSDEPTALESWKHQVTNVDPLVAEGLLDTPDSVAYVTDHFGRVEVIPAERQAAICAAFAALRRDPAHLDGFLLCGAVSQSDIADMMSELGGYAIEYRYDQRRRYEGGLILEDTGTNVLTESVEYDAVLWFPVKGTFLLYREGEYFGIQDGWYTFEVLTPLYARFERALSAVVENFTVRYPEYDGDYAFHNCSLKNVTFNENISEIGDYAFNINNIKELQLPNVELIIGKCAFKENDIQHIEIPENILEIKGAAFSNNEIHDENITDPIIYSDGIYCICQNLFINLA